MIKDYVKNRKRALWIIGISFFSAWSFSSGEEFDQLLFLINLITWSLLIPKKEEKPKEATIQVSSKGIARHINSEYARKSRYGR